MPPKKTGDTKKSKVKKEKADDGAQDGENESRKRDVKTRKAAAEQTQAQPTQVPQVAQCARGGAAVVAKWVQRALDMGVDALRGEYRSLARYTLPEMTCEAFKANQEAGRNRYQDVPCQDQFRVVLKWPGAPTDYVHANYVGTPVSEKRFICAQGPLDGTIPEFWMMVLQEESETIIMLTNCIERGKFKCSAYWPDRVGETKTFSGIEITNLQIRAMSPDEPSVALSILSVKFPKDGGFETREVRHYQWLDWPDRGVPPIRLTSMELLSRVRGTRKPIIVHCSAGIGRTGTIVAIEYILERMQAGVECAAMCELLKELRNHRAYSIQNDLQYLYVHRVILCYFLEKHRNRYASILHDENKSKYAKFISEYNAATGTQ
ncbi:unnamed protein product [Cylicocyclus nassatus]|uniref:Protein-tyrosine phosphatase n=1 Tax=Cylicocyclus nassatus TaxID=53992 RepID=A0AA36H9R3_CYLNA|nr:unnamed protein product [Cylicocyclus nassatus]